MLAVLGAFVFDLRTAPFDRLRRSTSWLQEDVKGINANPSHQFLGQRRETIELNGELRPQITAGVVSLSVLRAMAASGKSWLLIGGNGEVFGSFVIVEITENRSVFFRDGVAKKIDFTISIQRTADSLTDQLGVLAEFIGPAVQGVTRSVVADVNSNNGPIGSALTTVNQAIRG